MRFDASLRFTADKRVEEKTKKVKSDFCSVHDSRVRKKDIQTSVDRNHPVTRFRSEIDEYSPKNVSQETRNMTT